MENNKNLTDEQIENANGGVTLSAKIRYCPKCGAGGMYIKEFGTNSKGDFTVWACRSCGETFKIYPTPLQDKLG